MNRNVQKMRYIVFWGGLGWFLGGLGGCEVGLGCFHGPNSKDRHFRSYEDTGYPHGHHANNAAYPHDGRADNAAYPHYRHI